MTVMHSNGTMMDSSGVKKKRRIQESESLLSHQFYKLKVGEIYCYFSKKKKERGWGVKEINSGNNIV